MNSRKMVAAIALSVVCAGLVMAADAKSPIKEIAKSSIKEIALAQADAESALVEVKQIVADQTLFRGNIDKYRALFNEGMDCIRKARQDESNKGDARSEAVITGCNEDEAALNVKFRNDENTVRQAEIAWQKVCEKHNIMFDAFNRLSSTTESWKRADLDAAPVIAMNKTITAASATVKESAETCIEQVKALVVDMEAKVKEIKAKYTAPAAVPAAGK